MISERTFRSNVKKIVSDYITKQGDEFSGFDQRLILHIEKYNGGLFASVNNLDGDTREFKVFYNEDNRRYVLSVYKQIDVKSYNENLVNEQIQLD